MLLVVLLVAALTPALAKTVDFDALTIADINKAFDSRHVDGRTADAAVVSRASRPTIVRGCRCAR